MFSLYKTVILCVNYVTAYYFDISKNKFYLDIPMILIDI